MKHYEYEINLFIDNELPAHGQKELFAHLAVCDECTELFHQYNKLKRGAKEYFDGIDTGAVDSIVALPAPAMKKNEKTYRKHFYISSAAAAILLLLSLFQFYQSDENINKYNNVKKELLSLRDSIKSPVIQNGINRDHIVFEKAEARKVNTLPRNSSKPGNNINSPEENLTGNIISNEDFFNMAAGQYNIHIIPEQNKGISKYFGTDTYDSPSVTRLIDSKNGMSDYERNIYEYLRSDPAYNKLLMNSISEKKDKYRRQFVRQNAVHDNNIRDLKYREKPFIDKNGKYHPADIAGVRDLFLREGEKYKMKPAKKKSTPETTDIVKRESRYNDYLSSFKKEQVTQSDFLTPQILGN